MTEKSKDQIVDRYLNAESQEFVGLLVHDLRGPLTGIISATKLLDVILAENETSDQAQLQELITLLLQATDDMRLILDAAIDYHRARQK